MVITRALLCFENQSCAFNPAILSNRVDHDETRTNSCWLIYPRPIVVSIPCESVGMILVDVGFVQVDFGTLYGTIRVTVSTLDPKILATCTDDVVSFLQAVASASYSMHKSPTSKRPPQCHFRNLNLAFAAQIATNSINANVLPGQIRTSDEGTHHRLKILTGRAWRTPRTSH